MSLKFLIELIREDEPPRIWVTCPICKRTDWYYTLCIEKCDLCGASMINIRDITTHLDKRLKFHREGINP